MEAKRYIWRIVERIVRFERTGGDCRRKRRQRRRGHELIWVAIDSARRRLNKCHEPPGGCARFLSIYFVHAELYLCLYSSYSSKGTAAVTGWVDIK